MIGDWEQYGEGDEFGTRPVTQVVRKTSLQIHRLYIWVIDSSTEGKMQIRYMVAQTSTGPRVHKSHLGLLCHRYFRIYYSYLTLQIHQR